jgi:predicted ABC-type ATPase
MSDERYKLSKEDHIKIFHGLLNDMLVGTEYQEQPRIIILGGQPGSGKSKLTEIARNSVFENQPVAIINGDDYRAYHPNAREIYERHDEKFAEMTDHDVRKWTSELLGAAINEKRNIIFEATMRNKEPLMTTIKYLKEQGYQIGIMVMAVNEQISRVRIVERYENQKAEGGIARWTPMESHDEAYKNMPHTAAAIENNSSIDSISVYNRAGEILYKNERRIDGVFERPLAKYSAESVIQRERERPLTKLEMENLQQTIKDIQERVSETIKPPHEIWEEESPKNKPKEQYSKKIAIITTEMKMGDGVNIYDAGDGRYTGKLVALTGEVPDKWAVLEVGDEQAVMFSVRDKDQAATLMSDETLAVLSSDGVIDEVHETWDSEQELDGEYER